MEPIIRRPPGAGWIEVICGSMFSGKTEELIRRLRRARIARQQVAIFKPALDSRYAEDAIVSHNANRIPSISIESADQLLLMAGDAAVIGVDEAQFFGMGLVRVCNQLAKDGKRVIVVGLDMDYLGNPFEPIPQLMSIAEHVTKLHAICVSCGSPALYSHRIAESQERVLLGEKDAYEPRCRACFEVDYTSVDRSNHESPATVGEKQ